MLKVRILILDPYEDQFEKKFEAKKERFAKNEYQRLRNIARNRKISGQWDCSWFCCESLLLLNCDGWCFLSKDICP